MGEVVDEETFESGRYRGNTPDGRRGVAVDMGWDQIRTLCQLRIRSRSHQFQPDRRVRLHLWLDCRYGLVRDSLVAVCGLDVDFRVQNRRSRKWPIRSQKHAVSMTSSGSGWSPMASSGEGGTPRMPRISTSFHR